MPNERLRAAMVTAGWTCATLAAEVGVDPKTVERWVSIGRTPHRVTAVKTAEKLGEDVQALWPALAHARRARAANAELVALYGQRAELSVTAFVDLIAQAREHVDMLVYAAVFLHEAYPGLNDLLRERATKGCAIRVAVGDPNSANIQQRGREERFGDGIESRCRLAAMHYSPIARTPGIAIRQHGTTLYNSLYRADDQMLVNSHVWGVNAYSAPVWHLRRHSKGGMFDTYAESFEAAWATAVPVREG
ncbi:helix-turn-helix domain-containing protein [Streptomyces albireticuli]|uniref:XRE family transcriptional regulator n=1 Tax=Streptomyces albireticuli TaxID=1940 RepID=A0A2A2DF08_9ACTN|nr:helix-turn-helix domain-containing protein [Streptomyces albireticuli]MCD9144475.1 helix-turn-helix domain-containing protein [Streptomyces albireticuli]MCD9163462.1 helix-turn-helix domain-containing protein [Streptomyces albireticuli]MCD9193152.1 helix-turn-helix domain-containing protein [Streptomyces albireticuli]PAU49852.1 XRE family transcriptional regulator [Streptomyces albireticuli]